MGQRLLLRALGSRQPEIRKVDEVFPRFAGQIYEMTREKKGICDMWTKLKAGFLDLAGLFVWTPRQFAVEI